MDNTRQVTTRPLPPAFAETFVYWLKLGFLSFGGPAGQIAMMHQELVERRRWISERRFLHALNYCMVLPGPEATQLAVYLNWLLHGVAGGIIAGILFFLPGFLLLSLLAAVYLTWGHVPLVQGMFYGIKPAVVAIVLFAAWKMGARVLQNSVLWGMAALAFVAIFCFNIGFPWIVLAAGLLGALGGKFMPETFRSGSGQGVAHKQYGLAVVDDDTPTPEHARFSLRKLLLTLTVFVLVWWLAMLAVSGNQTLEVMGSFFTRAAFLTIGGAYAVLPYVYQGGVENYGWLSGAQMMDGLALGETTPGPLIMVVTWVGYLGGASQGVASSPWFAGLAGAGVATFFTFLPSFLFILAGGPLVEATRNELRFTAPLTGITAAVVGVILNLAAFFAWHTFWPQASVKAPFAGGMEWFPVIVATGAFMALWKYQTDIMHVISMCAAFGLIYTVLAGLVW